MLGSDARAPVGSRNRSSMEQWTDAALLTAIGRQRDEEAFAILFQRHHLHLYNLALCLTGSHSLAQDALQEAMLKVWSAAARFVDGNPEAWLLKIVSRRCLTLLKSERIRRAHTEEAQQGRAAQCPEPGGEAVGRQEALVRLRAAIAELSESDRRLVALHFGAGLSQRELARLLQMPQSTISHHCARIIAGLRGELRRAGAFGVAPLAEAGMLREAVLSSQAVPQGLLSALLRQVPALPPPVPQGLFAGMFGLLPARSAPLLGGVLVAGLTLAGWASHGRLWGESVAATRSVPGSTVPGADARAAILFRHDFKDRPPPGLIPLADRWFWRPAGPGLEGCLVAPQLEPCGLLWLPVPNEPGPLRISFRARWGGGQECLFLLRAGADSALPCQMYQVERPTRVSGSSVLLESVIYSIDRWMVYYLNGELDAIHQYDSPVRAHEGLIVGARSLTIAGIEIERIPEAECPLSPGAIRKKIQGLSGGKNSLAGLPFTDFPAGPELVRLEPGMAQPSWGQRLGLDGSRWPAERLGWAADFEAEAASASYRVLEGGWNWVRLVSQEQEGRSFGAMACKPGGVTIAMPVPLSPGRAWVLELALTAFVWDKAGLGTPPQPVVGVEYLDGIRRPPARMWFGNRGEGNFKRPGDQLRCYGIGNFLILMGPLGRPVVIAEVRQIRPAFQLALCLKDLALSACRWSPLSAEEIPPGLRDIAETVRGMGESAKVQMRLPHLAEKTPETPVAPPPTGGGDKW